MDTEACGLSLVLEFVSISATELNCLSRSAFAWRGLAPIQTVRRRYAVTM